MIRLLKAKALSQIRCRKTILILKLNQHLGGVPGYQNHQIDGGTEVLQSLFSNLGGDVTLINTEVFIIITIAH